MRMRWKLVGLAGLAGVAATGVALARNRPEPLMPSQLAGREHDRRGVQIEAP